MSQTKMIVAGLVQVFRIAIHGRTEAVALSEIFQSSGVYREPMRVVVATRSKESGVEVISSVGAVRKRD